MDKSKKLIIVIILLIIIIGGVSFYAFHQAKENKEMSELFAVEKLEMENEYTTFATQYDELQVQINNDSLRERLESEKLKTQRLLEELRQVKTSNAAEIMRLKKELKTVRAVLRTYVIQIDSLNKLNQALAEENQEVKQKYTQATRQISNLSQEKKNGQLQVSGSKNHLPPHYTTFIPHCRGYSSLFLMSAFRYSLLIFTATALLISTSTIL